MNEPDYTMKLMLTYGGLTVNNRQKELKIIYKENNRATKTTTFSYTNPFSNHFLHCHGVDDHNKLHHSSPPTEETWITHRWPNRFFAYLFATSELNTFLAYR